MTYDQRETLRVALQGVQIFRNKLYPELEMWNLTDELTEDERRSVLKLIDQHEPQNVHFFVCGLLNATELSLTRKEEILAKMTLDASEDYSYLGRYVPIVKDDKPAE